MQNNFKYINLSWAVVGICERPWVGNQRSGMNARQPLLFHIPGIDKDEAAAVEHYVIGYMAFWHIAFVDESRLVFPRFYLVLLRQPIAPMESDGMSRVYQM